MGKYADQFILCEPWAIAQEGFDPERNRVAESLFSLANETMGVRGYAEEGTDAPSLIGSYLNGVYEWGSEPDGGTYRGVVRRTHYMVCAADWLYTRLSVNGQMIRPDASSAYQCRLDFRTGLLTRSYAVILSDGNHVQVCFERIVSMAHPRCAGQRVTVYADGDVALSLTMGVDGSVCHATTGACQWRQTARDAQGNRSAISLMTATTQQEITYLFSVDTPIASTVQEDERRSLRCMDAALHAGQPFVAEKRVMVLENAPWELSVLDSSPSFDDILRENAVHFAAFWKRSDVVIQGDDEAQQGIRFCLFQLHQTYRGLDGSHNIGAKGLTGEAYNGHAFWDSETYCLPYYLLSDPAAAKGLLMYRYHTLPQAKQRAKELDCKGACYPIATLNGYEACTLWQHASLQMQPSTAVAYAIVLYADMTGDTQFLYREGIEMLVEISRYVVSRGAWNNDHTGFGFWGVMGPDEFHIMVNNDFYTNYMGKKTLEETLRILRDMPSGTCIVPPEEQAQWQEIAQHMIFHRDEQDVPEQQDGFFTLPHLDIHAIPAQEFPLYEHWSYDRIYHTDMIKQPDVLMAMFLHPEDFSRAELSANYDYYEPRCIHESSLSPSIHAVLAQALERYDDAFRFFDFATRMDLDNYNRNTGDGLHTTSIAAAWITIVFGFGGLRLQGDQLALHPRLPDAWKACSFHLCKGESVIRVDLTRDGCTLSLVDGKPVTLLLDGETIEVR